MRDDRGSLVIKYHTQGEGNIIKLHDFVMDEISRQHSEGNTYKTNDISIYFYIEFVWTVSLLP